MSRRTPTFIAGGVLLAFAVSAYAADYSDPDPLGDAMPDLG